MAAYSSTQSGNFNNPATWGGSGWPDTNTDTFTVNAGHTVTYNITTPLNEGLGSSVVNSGGTFIIIPLFVLTVLQLITLRAQATSSKDRVLEHC
jgi:hypothetical protein